MVEIWKDIKGYEGLYQVSNLGRVKSLSIYRKNSVCEYYSKEKILKPLKDKGGYLNVRLWKNKKGKTIKIHRLVACNFLENIENKRDVNHINGIKTDIALSTRASKANKAKADILISNHYNAIGSCAKWQTRVKGLLVLRTKNCSEKSIKLGKLAVKHLKKDIDYEYSYGLMRDVDMSGFTLAILRQTTMPAILIEYGFMDYWNEAKLMLDKKHQEKCAEAVAKAVCEYFRVTYIAEKQEANKTKYVRILKDINIHSKPDFDAANVIGKVTAGGAYTITEKVKRTGTDMYKLKSGVYITASPKYVEVFEK